ncbi:hypothetical protein AAFF_G00026510 [Aldrovandia affinis]|uniref:Tc1-like transposase DDE domain-containing protein n=1 Tax=Aldrovandia affinis TaxID=143900 RepID=A0AAD7S503_9TELE|nr:hypothetical protein AAFF_G00026510 [Aldrovandia affinis]
MEAQPTRNTSMMMNQNIKSLIKRKRGRNIIGQRVTVNVPGQREGNITICAAISMNGVVVHNVVLGPYNTARLLRFLDSLNDTLIPQEEQDLEGPELMKFVVVWDNIHIHHSLLVREWFATYPARD